MLKYIDDAAGIMSLTLSHVGLLVATVILLVAVFSVIYSNDWQKQAELETIAQNFIYTIQATDTQWYEHVTTFHFPEKTYWYAVNISTEYVTVISQGTQHQQLSIKKHLLVFPWPRFENNEWKSGEELHNYCQQMYYHQGIISDPLPEEGTTELLSLREQNKAQLANQPFQLQIQKSVSIEKVLIYCDVDDDGIWTESCDDLIDLNLVYQLE
jgi:hypothetical protein